MTPAELRGLIEEAQKYGIDSLVGDTLKTELYDLAPLLLAAWEAQNLRSRLSSKSTDEDYAAVHRAEFAFEAEVRRRATSKR